MATAAGLLLLAAGLLVQLELGLGAMESSWLRHFQKTTALLAIGLGLGAHLRLRLQGRALTLPFRPGRFEWMLAALAGAALLGLLTQVVLGANSMDGAMELCAVLGWAASGSSRGLPAHAHAADSLLRMPADKMIVRQAGCEPEMLAKFRYYHDAGMQRMVEHNKD